MSRPLREQVIVITGASTGIGRETALMAAGRGARLVIAARGEQALHEVAERIRAAGGDVLVVPTDVADSGQVDHLAQAAVERFGRVDTWINNAGVGAYATVEQMTPAEFERIVQVDLLGPIYGCRAILPHMKRAGAGTIVNVGSGLSDRAVPLMSAYCAAKSGLKGFTDALRMELMRDTGGAIAVTLILPSAVNTEFFDHARSKTGLRPRPIAPVYEPGVVAEAILFAAEHPRRDVYAGGASKLLSVMERISPTLLDWYMVQNGKMFKDQLSSEPDDGEDNLFRPGRDGRAARGPHRKAHRRSFYTRYVDLHPNVKHALITGAVAAGILLFRAAAGSARNTRTKVSRASRRSATS
jgi:short-subunit dehydrogenase